MRPIDEETFFPKDFPFTPDAAVLGCSGRIPKGQRWGPRSKVSATCVISEGSARGENESSGHDTRQVNDSTSMDDLLRDLDAFDADNASWRQRLRLVREAITHRMVENRNSLYTMILYALEAQVAEEAERLIRSRGSK